LNKINSINQHNNDQQLRVVFDDLDLEPTEKGVGDEDIDTVHHHIDQLGISLKRISSTLIK